MSTLQPSIRIVRTPQGACLLGVARADITPPVGIYHRMWGAATHDRATGVHRPLSATAVYFGKISADGNAPASSSSSDAEQYLISMDLCLLWAPELSALKRRVSEKTGVAQERLLIVFTHTHSAGLMGMERIDLPGGDLIPAYLDRLAEVSAEIVSRARASAQPVTLVYGRGSCDLARQRDYWDDEAKLFACGYNPAGGADETLLVAKAVDHSGKTIATFVNYACHPTTLAWENTLISPDYPGALRETVEAGAGGVCVFLQGASGDLGPLEGFVGETSVADRNGRQLAYAALAALEALPKPETAFAYQGPVVSGATLGDWRHVPISAAEKAEHRRWEVQRFEVDLAIRSDIPTLEQTKTKRAQLMQEEQAARDAGDAKKGDECRALIERLTRLLTRLVLLPSDGIFPLPVCLWRIGDAIWVGVEGECYQYLQRTLRERFPNHTIFVMTLADGSRCTYLPTQETYHRGIYQESIALLAPGSLEKLTQALVEKIAGVFSEPEA